MAETISLKGTEQVCNATANTFGGRVVRLTNQGTTAVLVTQANSGGTIGTFTLLANTSVVIVKGASDTLASANNTAVLGVPVGYSY